VKPGLLIASPQLKDPNFVGTVVLLCHHDDEGALGVIINRVTNLSLRELVEQLDIDSDSSLHSASDTSERVFWGGPVEQGAGFVVFGGQVEDEQGWNLPAELAVSPSRQLLESVLGSGAPFFLCLGYAGWGPGQLDAEIATGSWLYTELDRGLVFDDEIEQKYDRALGTLGLRPEQIWMVPVDE